MALSLTTAPAVEPVTLEIAKANLRVTGSAEDDLIERYIEAARVWAETFTERAFITQTWTLTLHRFPLGPIVLPRPPLQSVTSVQYVDSNGDTQTWSASSYTVVQPSGDYAMPGCIVPAYNEVYPTTRGHVEDVTVTFVAGYGSDATDVPYGIRHGILERLDDLYANRDASGEANERALASYVAWMPGLQYA